MNVAKWVLLSVLALPLVELTVFVAVAAAIGLGWALLLIIGTSFAGLMVLRRAGGNHIARARVAMTQGSFSALQADGAGGLVLLAGFLLLVPGFITDLVALLLFIAPLRRALAAAFGVRKPAAAPDGVVDLDPEQWHRVPDPALADRRNDDGEP
ncbi:MAG TPA: FxsA family protein [Pseudolabrys sp.]|jgi:UPF0716 protein FxsA|nr:FxsA family protein [Pseudolabrys sp.]